MSKYDLKDEEDFWAVQTDAKNYYDSLVELYCPYLKERICFNSKGWEHIIFKKRDRYRARKDQYVRYKLLPLAIKIISNSHTLQGFRITNKFEIVNINSRWENLLKQVTFWEFMAVMEDVRVKIIVKQAEGGEKHFFSVIPYWRIRPGTNERILYGNFPVND